jgi:hypothetical protein
MPRKGNLIETMKGYQFVVTIALWLTIMCLPAGMRVDEARHTILIWTTSFASSAGSVPGASSSPPTNQAMPAKGMSKEMVRDLWGDPAEVRKIRTCFGWQEEWMYRGNPRRYGADERTLLFDEGEALHEIK